MALPTTRGAAPRPGSAFMACPCCGRSVPASVINVHLDEGCSLRPSPPAAAASAPPPHKRQRTQQQQQQQTQLGGEGAAAAHAGPSTVASQEGAPSSTSWWRTAATAVASARHTPSGKSFPLTASQLAAVGPFELVQGALEPAAAEALLLELLQQSRSWEQGSWFYAGKEVAAPRLTVKYELCNGASGSGGGGSASASANGGSRGRDNAELQPDVGSDKQMEPQRQQHEGSVNPTPGMSAPGVGSPPALLQAAALIATAVNARRGGCAAMADREQFEPTYAIANLYRMHADYVGAHSDCLTSIGPLPVIASLTLGAGRLFRLRRIAGAAAPEPSPLRSSGGSSPAVGPSACDVVDIQLKHNALLIMWPPCQEEWLHEVPAISAAAASSGGLAAHPLYGPARINLTFRQHKQEWADRAPRCKVCSRCCCICP